MLSVDQQLMTKHNTLLIHFDSYGEFFEKSCFDIEFFGGVIVEI